MSFLGGFVHSVGCLPLYIAEISFTVSVIIRILDISAEYRQKYRAFK